jgi:hypothetical protein
MNSWINLSALWRIAVVGILAGAGLPAIFAIGLRALNQPASGVRDSDGPQSVGSERVYGGNPIGLLFASVCFAAVLAAVGWGIYEIVQA